MRLKVFVQPKTRPSDARRFVVGAGDVTPIGEWERRNELRADNTMRECDSIEEVAYSLIGKSESHVILNQ
jgi:hypothetical protein